MNPAKKTPAKKMPARAPVRDEDDFSHIPDPTPRQAQAKAAPRQSTISDRQFGPVYHATSHDRAASIMKGGYQHEAASNTHLLSHGPGVYTFADRLTASAYAEGDHGDRGAVVEGHVHNPKVYEVPHDEARRLQHAKWDGDSAMISDWHHNLRTQGYNVASTEIGHEPAHVVLDPSAFRASRVHTWGK